MQGSNDSGHWSPVTCHTSMQSGQRLNHALITQMPMPVWVLSLAVRIRLKTGVLSMEDEQSQRRCMHLAGNKQLGA